MTYQETYNEAATDALDQLMDCYATHPGDLCPKLRLLAETIKENLDVARDHNGHKT